MSGLVWWSADRISIGTAQHLAAEILDRHLHGLDLARGQVGVDAGKAFGDADLERWRRLGLCHGEQPPTAARPTTAANQSGATETSFWNSHTFSLPDTVCPRCAKLSVWTRRRPARSSSVMTVAPAQKKKGRLSRGAPSVDLSKSSLFHQRALAVLEGTPGLVGRNRGHGSCKCRPCSWIRPAPSPRARYMSRTSAAVLAQLGVLGHDVVDRHLAHLGHHRLGLVGAGRLHGLQIVQGRAVDARRQSCWAACRVLARKRLVQARVSSFRSQ